MAIHDLKCGRARPPTAEILIANLHLAEGERFNFNNGVELARLLSQSPRAKTCYALHWTRYATGLHLHENDVGISEIQKAFLDNDNVKSLLVTITGSDLFRYRKAGGNQ